MKYSGTVLARILDALDLNEECLPHVPLIEIAGQNRVIIENHLCVNAYGSSLISVSVSYGHLEITGRDLKLLQMAKQRLIISGTVESIKLIGGGV